MSQSLDLCLEVLDPCPLLLIVLPLQGELLGDLRVIENDLFRTTHSTNEDDQRALRRVLQAYVLFCPQVGYCQGMSYLAHLIIGRIQDEATSFWMFVTLMERYGLKSFYLPDLRRLKVVCYQLDVLTKRHLPELHSH